MRSPRSPLDFRGVLSTQIQDAAAALAGEAPDEAAVHDARTAIRKARALVRVGAASAPGMASLFQETARATMGYLGAARDLYVQERAATLAATASGGKKARALIRIAGALEALRFTGPQSDLGAARQGLRDLLAMAQVWPEMSDRQVRRGAKAVARRARRARRRGIASRSLKRRHEWRLREKDRLHAAVMLGESWPKRRGIRLSSRLADVLGKERDVALLIARLNLSPPPNADSPKTIRRALAALTKRKARLTAIADTLGEKLRQRGV